VFDLREVRMLFVECLSIRISKKERVLEEKLIQDWGCSIHSNYCKSFGCVIVDHDSSWVTL